MNQYHKIMERFWLFVAIASFIFAVYKTGEIGIGESMMYYLFPFIAGILFYMRYFVRKRFEKRSGED